MTLFNVRNAIVSNMAEFADTFNMTNNGSAFFETEYEMRAVYLDEIVDYIEPQEEGFRHWISGNMVTKNKGFISVKATGKINRMIWAEQNGFEIDYNEENQALLENQNNILLQMGGMKLG